LVQMRQTSVKIPCWHWLHMRHNSSATSDELPSSAKTNSTHAVYSDLRPCETASANVVAVPSPPRRCIKLQETTALANRYDTARDIFGGTELQVERHGHVVFQQVLDLIFVYLEPSSAPSSCPVQTLCHAVGGVLFHRTRGADSLSDALACESSRASRRREGIGLRTFPPFCTPWPKKLITSLIMTRTFSLLAGPPHACTTASRSAVQLQAERYGASYIPSRPYLPCGCVHALAQWVYRRGFELHAGGSLKPRDDDDYWTAHAPAAHATRKKHGASRSTGRK
jgi:hypothetical protein